MATATTSFPNLDPLSFDRPGDVDFDEFCVLIQSDQKADLLNGIIYVASPESLDANDLFLWLSQLFRDYVGPDSLGKVYGSRVAFRLGDSYSPEPDLAFVRADRMHLKRKTYFDGPPDLAVEIVSPESVRRDYELKREAYRAAGVPEYWIVDEEARRATVCRLDAEGRYEPTRISEGRLQSTMIPGFWVDVAWLWTDDRPSNAAALAAILNERDRPK